MTIDRELAEKEGMTKRIIPMAPPLVMIVLLKNFLLVIRIPLKVKLLLPAPTRQFREFSKPGLTLTMNSMLTTMLLKQV